MLNDKRLTTCRDRKGRYYKRRNMQCSICNDIMPIVYLVEDEAGERTYVCPGCFYRNKKYLSLAVEKDFAS